MSKAYAGARLRRLREALADGPDAGQLHRYDPATRVLHLSPRLRPGRQAFRMATQLALLEFGDELSRHAAAATPIGMGCKVCERLDCPQRAVPPLGRRLAVDENRTTFVPYPVEPAGP